MTTERENYYKNLSRKQLGYNDEQMFMTFIHSKESTKIKTKVWNKIEKILKEEYKQNVQKFQEKHVNFHFNAEKCSDPEVTNRLLWSFGLAFGHCSVLSVKMVDDELQHDRVSDNWPYLFPGGNKVVLIHSSKPNILNFMMPPRYRMKYRELFTVINIDEINEIKGKLESFIMYFKNGREIRFSEGSIYDLN